MKVIPAQPYLAKSLPTQCPLLCTHTHTHNHIPTLPPSHAALCCGATATSPAPPPTTHRPLILVARQGSCHDALHCAPPRLYPTTTAARPGSPQQYLKQAHTRPPLPPYKAPPPLPSPATTTASLLTMPAPSLCAPPLGTHPTPPSANRHCSISKPPRLHQQTATAPSANRHASISKPPRLHQQSATALHSHCPVWTCPLTTWAHTRTTI